MDFVNQILLCFAGETRRSDARFLRFLKRAKIRGFILALKHRRIHALGGKSEEALAVLRYGQRGYPSTLFWARLFPGSDSQGPGFPSFHGG